MEDQMQALLEQEIQRAVEVGRRLTKLGYEVHENQNQEFLEEYNEAREEYDRAINRVQQVQGLIEMLID